MIESFQNSMNDGVPTPPPLPTSPEIETEEAKELERLWKTKEEVWIKRSDGTLQKGTIHGRGVNDIDVYVTYIGSEDGKARIKKVNTLDFWGWQKEGKKTKSEAFTFDKLEYSEKEELYKNLIAIMDGKKEVWLQRNSGEWQKGFLTSVGFNGSPVSLNKFMLWQEHDK